MFLNFILLFYSKFQYLAINDKIYIAVRIDIILYLY